MKIVTVLGTRPEIIRLSLIVKKLDQLCEHILVHTGQNFDRNLSDLFFEDMEIRKPDHYLEVRGSSIADQIGQLLVRCEAVFEKEKPDRILILGDTNSALCALVAKRMGIPVYHMEAGNRCFDDRVPEEVNRRIVDHSSDILLPYTHRSKENLYREGFPVNRVYVTGNPINEVIQAYHDKIESSQVLAAATVEPVNYFLATIHRAENVDVISRLESIVAALNGIADEYKMPVLVSTHPRTRARLDAATNVNISSGVKFVEPFGFFDFIKLEKNALCVLSDSGTVQEECSIFGVPTVTVRDVTERPETIDCGSNLLSGAEADSIMGAVRAVIAMKPRWIAPHEYIAASVSDTVCRILLSYNHKF